MSIIRIITITGLLLIWKPAFSQKAIRGNFPALANQYVKLVGLEGFDSYAIDSVKVDGEGGFSLSFEDKDYGIGYLVAQDDQPFIVILCCENIKLKGENLAIPETVDVIAGPQNKIFEKYASEHPIRESALSAWNYLKQVYAQVPLFKSQSAVADGIEQERQRVAAEDSLFLAGLDAGSYVSWYLSTRKLLNTASTVVQGPKEKIPPVIAAFRDIDYADNRLYKSGLLKDVLESHFWLIENSGQSLDSVFEEMKISIDRFITSLVTDGQRLNDIAAHLFKFLESRSLFSASEYLAVKLLNESKCSIDSDFAAQLDKYRAMQMGNTVSDFAFTGDILAPGYPEKDKPGRLSDIKSKYTLLVFGSSWCPACPPELAQIITYYEKWKSEDVEILFVSLDESEEKFKAFANIFPFISLCDYQKWESPVVKSYHVSATPTIYLLDKNLTIVLNPDSAEQVNAWLESAVK